MGGNAMRTAGSVIVFFRSHANPNIFRQFPRRFTVVPTAVLVAQLVSHWVLLFAVAVTVLWDVYHRPCRRSASGGSTTRGAGSIPSTAAKYHEALTMAVFLLASRFLEYYVVWQLRSARAFPCRGRKSRSSCPWIGWGYEYGSGRVAWGLLAVVNTVAIMHFWYDGFVWSVRKHQVVQT